MRPTANAAASPVTPPSAIPTARVPVARPQVDWFARETTVPSSSCSWVWPSAGGLSACSASCAALASSTAMAASTCGSPTVYATEKASRPAISPARSPRTRKLRAVISVAREAEEVASVVDPLVDGVATDDRDQALLRADEEHDDGGGEEDEGCPRSELCDGNRRYLDLGGGGDGCL